MYIYIYIYIYIHIHVYIYIYICIPIYLSLSLSISLSLYIYTHIYIYIFIYIREFTSQDFEMSAQLLCGSVESANLRSTCWQFYMGKCKSLQISAVLRKASTTIAQTDAKILARKIPYAHLLLCLARFRELQRMVTIGTLRRV